MKIDNKTTEDARNIMYTYELDNLNNEEEIIDWIIKLLSYEKFIPKVIELAERPFGTDEDTAVFEVSPQIDRAQLMDSCVNNCVNRITIMGKFENDLAIFVVLLNNATIKATIRKIMIDEYIEIEKDLNLV